MFSQQLGAAENPVISKPALEASVEVIKLPVQEKGRPGFEGLDASKHGLVPAEQHQKPEKARIRETGNSGLAAGDVDGDGLVDLFVCGMDGPNVLYRNQGNWQFKDITAQAGVACKSWRMSGAVFADVDGDSDLDLITVSLRDGRNFLFLNDGKGNFTESLGINWVTHPRGGSVASALADVDGDGDLDLFVTGFLREFLHDNEPKIFALGERVMGNLIIQAQQEGRPISIQEIQLGLPRVCRERYVVLTRESSKGHGYALHPGHMPDILYLNDGNGNFRAITDADARFLDERGRPMPMPRNSSHEPAFRDVDNDGDPDLYVCADFDFPDRFWINDGAGRFRLINKLAIRRTSQFAMGIDFTDLNRDGHLDFMTVDMLSRDHKRRKTQMGMMNPTPVVVGRINNQPQIMQNTLFLNRGDSTWTEIAQYAGLKASEWSWATVFTDVDLDGYEDLLVSTGMTRDFMDSDALNQIEQEKANALERGLNEPQKKEYEIELNRLFPKLETPNVAFRNQGNLTFEDVSEKWGFKTEAVSGGIALADFDNDGDLDAIINNEDAPLEVYRNTTVAPRVAVRLLGRSPNTQAIGAKVRLIGGPGGPAPQEQEIHCGAGYASGSDTLVVFGTGDKKTGLKLEITWRNGGKTVVDNVEPNNRYVVRETKTAENSPRPEPTRDSISHFTIADRELAPAKRNFGNIEPGHYHIDQAFDDFERQSLLPNRLSQLGPSVVWADINGDGHEDLMVGSGGGGGLVIFLGQADGGFVSIRGPTIKQDMTGMVGWIAAPGKPALLAGISNFEAVQIAGIPSVRVVQPDPEKQFAETQVLPGDNNTTGPLAVADVDSDGDLDLFVGGRTIPGRYPEPADSKLYLNNNGTLEPDNANSDSFKKLGLVSGAVFGDLDNDGDADLAIALEWGPIRIFRNNAGKFTDITAALSLDAYTGWWNSVTLGDLDGDGRLDLVAGNWGLNSKYQQSYSREKPLRITYGDFDENGVLDIVEYHFDKQTGKLVPERGRSCTSRAMDFIGKSNPTFNTFGSRSLEEIYGTCLKEGKVVEANTLAHMVFLNRGDKFEGRQMPTESQFSPVFGVNVADFDGDGDEDVFVAQNFFASQIETPRSDGGRGLLMLGDGQGGLKPMPGHKSGLTIYGDQRGSAVGDFDVDGRPDLVVAQNGNKTRLFRNALAKPGLRVHLDAGASNPTGVGAVARLRFEGDKLGPARAVTAGSGYWSQDSATLILAVPTNPTHIEVRWPGGKTTSTQLLKNTSEITVNTEGKLTASK